ncbi:MAG: hypothetical protein GY757_48830 [bacterium]|nr:hypothetical protein [bacterium]
MKRLTIALLSLLMLASCRADKNGETCFSYEPDGEEYAVYSALINRYCDSSDGGSLLTIKDHTVAVFVKFRWDPYEFFEYIAKNGSFRMSNSGGESTKEINIRDIGKDTLDDFGRKNIYSSPLYYQFRLNIKYLLIGEKERTFIRGKTYLAFRARYPNSRNVSVSRVGLNKKRDIALVYYSNSLAGYLMILKKINGRWVVKGYKQLWMV